MLTIKNADVYKIFFNYYSFLGWGGGGGPLRCKFLVSRDMQDSMVVREKIGYSWNIGYIMQQGIGGWGLALPPPPPPPPPPGKILVPEIELVDFVDHNS